MADIASTDVTYTIIKTGSTGDSRRFNVVKLTFGNATLTVPSGGIPLLKGSMGCPVTVDSLKVFDQSTSGYKYQYDYTNEKLIVMQAPAQTHTHDMKIMESITATGSVGINGSSFGKNTATNLTIAGANSTTLGGVVSATLAAAALAQASTVAIAAQTLYVEVVGY